MTVSKVGIVGSGLMGSGIAQVVAQMGTPTVLVKATGGEVDSLRDRVEERMAKAVDRGRLEAEVRDTVVANLSYTATLDDLKGCGLVVESIVEDLEPQ